MKKNLLVITFIVFCSTFGFGQMAKKGLSIAVFPNPAAEFISVSADESVKNLLVYNMAGRKVRSFDVEKTGEQYEIGDLPNGLYIVHVVDKHNKVMTIQRVTKRS